MYGAQSQVYLSVLRLCYALPMDKTLTIRLADEQDKALTRRAEATGKTKSQLARELIDKGLEEQPLGRRVGHLKGRIRLGSPKESWQKRIKERNWR